MKENFKIKIKTISWKNAEHIKGALRLYVEEGWYDANDEASYASVKKALKNSYCAFGAFCGKRMVGTFRALSDGVSDAYLLDLVVDKAKRGQGIGSALTYRITDFLKKKNMEWITAISTPYAKRMYLKIGVKMQGHTPIRFF